MPPAPPVPAPQILGVQYAAVVAPRIDASLDTRMFPRFTTGPVMNTDHHDIFVKFLKLKPLVFRGTEFEDASNFLYIIIRCFIRWI